VPNIASLFHAFALAGLGIRALPGSGTPRAGGAGNLCAGKPGNVRLDLLLSRRVHL